MSYDAYGFPSWGRGRVAYGGKNGDVLSEWRNFAADERAMHPGISREQLSAKWRRTRGGAGPKKKAAKKKAPPKKASPKTAKKRISFSKKPLGPTRPKISSKAPKKNLLKVKKSKAKIIEDLAKAGVKIAAEQEKAILNGDTARYNECQLLLSQVKAQAEKELQEFASAKKALGDKVLECESKASSLETKSRGYLGDIERMRENEEKLTQRLGNRDKTLESCMSGSSDLAAKLEACNMAKNDLGTQLMATEASEEGFENSLAECGRHLQKLQNAARIIEQEISDDLARGELLDRGDVGDSPWPEPEDLPWPEDEEAVI